MREKNISLLDLFLTFAKVGVMTFGGGYAMLPVIEKELIDKKQWMTRQDLMNFFAVSQVTPGVIAVNTASLLGYQKHRVLGALAATLGIITPSIIIITVIALFLKQYMSAELTERIFSSIRICVAALIVNALLPFFKKGIVSVFTGFLFAFSLAVYFCFKISPALLVVFCAITAIIYNAIKRKTAK